MKLDNAIVTVYCPRCKEEVGTVKAWLETEYSMEYDDETKQDKGTVRIEAKVTQRSTWSTSYVGATTHLDHVCDTEGK